jgi:hypothetical protein
MGKSPHHLQFRVDKTLFVAGMLALFFIIPVLLPAQVVVGISKTNVSCFGGNNGSATATASGGQSPYTFLWNTGANTATISGLVAGNYSVTVTDANQQTAIGSVSITQPNPLGVQVYGESQICGIAPDGKATAVYLPVE